MADEAKLPSEIEFFFEFDQNYRIVAANGVWGGLTPRGELQLDFFVERQGVPDVIRNSVIEGGRLGKEINRAPAKRIVRRLQVGVLLSIQEANNLAEFIKTRVAEYEKAKEKK